MSMDYLIVVLVALLIVGLAFGAMYVLDWLHGNV